jgi:catechol O-methyltransferase
LRWAVLDEPLTITNTSVELHKDDPCKPASAFTNNPWALADAIEDFANQVGHMMIFRKPKGDVAREQLLAQQPAPRTIVEFGTFVGKSALAWDAILRDIHGENVPEDINIYTFDPDAQMVELTREFVKLAGVEHFVHVLQGPGSDSLKTLHVRQNDDC